MITDSVVRLNGHAYEVIASHGEYRYRWREVALLRRGGQLYYVFGSGAGGPFVFESVVQESDLLPVKSWQEAVEASKVDLEPQDVVHFAEKLAEKRPAPSFEERDDTAACVNVTKFEDPGETIAQYIGRTTLEAAQESPADRDGLRDKEIGEAYLAGFWVGAWMTGNCCGCSGPAEEEAKKAYEQWLNEREERAGE